MYRCALIDALFNILQIIRISTGNTNAAREVVALAQKHIRDRGMNEENYAVPIGFRAQIRRIFQFYENRNPRQQNRQVTVDRLNKLVVRLRSFIQDNVPVNIRSNWEPVNIVSRNNCYYAICPSCEEPISVFDKSGIYFRSFNFTRHVKDHVPREGNALTDDPESY